MKTEHIESDSFERQLVVATNHWSVLALRKRLHHFFYILGLTFAIASLATAQRYTPATISDPDGYTNVRDGPGNASSIIGRVINNETFLTLKSSADWWPVQTQSELIGYMHISRIRMVATISDPDGFTYVRRGKGVTHTITGKVWDGEAFIAAPSTDSWWVVWMPDGRRGYMHSSRITSLPLHTNSDLSREGPSVESSSTVLAQADKSRINSAVLFVIGAVGSEFIKRETLNNASASFNEGDLGASIGYGLQAVAVTWLRDKCIESAISDGFPDLTSRQASDLTFVVGLALDGKLSFEGLSQEAQEHTIRHYLKASPPSNRSTVEILFFLRGLYQNAQHQQ